MNIIDILGIAYAVKKKKKAQPIKVNFMNKIEHASGHMHRKSGFKKKT